MSIFKPAERSQTKLRLALTGPAGSGKTLSALKIARGLVGPTGRIAVIDTENGSASYYAGEYKFDTAQLAPPYTIKSYIEAIRAATEAGYDCLVVDSLSHAWSGEGGVLQRKEAMDARGGNGFTNWAKMTPEQNQLVNAVLLSKTNIICTMRSKTEYSLEKNDRGKTEPKKIGLAPVQREGFDYEFDILLDIDVDTHTAKSSKDRTGIFAGLAPFMVTETAGAAIAKWQSSGAPMSPQPIAHVAMKEKEAPHGDFKEATPAAKPAQKSEPPKPLPHQTKEWFEVGTEIRAAMNEMGWKAENLSEYAREIYKKDVSMLTFEELKQVLFHIVNLPTPEQFQSDSRE